MPRKRTNYIDDAQWDDKEKKRYRQECIIGPTQKLFGTSLPPDKQYWTLCGAHFNKKTRTPLKGELGHAVDSGLIQPNQFHGVDHAVDASGKPIIIPQNRKFYPRANWHQGDFLEQMKKANKDKKFNPAVVNFDGVQQVKFSSSYVSKMFSFFDRAVPGAMLLVTSVILKSPYPRQKERDGNEFIEALVDCDPFWANHWKWSDVYYFYPGTGARSKTVMGVFTFVKEPHSEVVYSGRKIERIVA